MRRKKQAVDSKRRLPKQARARNTVDAIFEATAQILQQEETKRLTTNRIAERAGVAISTLYQYFLNKEAILVALARREMEIHRSAVVKAISAPPPSRLSEPDRLAIHALIDASGKRHRARRIAMETLIAQGLSHELASPVHEIARVVGENTGKLAPDLKEPLSPISLFVLTRAIQGVIGAGLREEPGFFRSPEFENELVRLVRGYIAQVAAG
jgi:AcrR family transcriptional regulator